MKVTKRELVLIGALLILLLGYCFYNFIYTKQVQKITELKTSRDTYSQKWEQAKVKIASKYKRDQQYNTLNAKILNETDKLFASIEQEQIIVVVDKMIKDSNLQADVLGFSEINSENTAADTSKTVNNVDKSNIASNEMGKLVSAFNATSKNASNSEKPSTNTATAKFDTSNIVGAYKMQVTLKFKGMYNELTNFVSQVEGYDKNIVINSIKLDGAEGSDVSGILMLDFYGIPKLNNNDDFKWEYKTPNGNSSPFLGSITSLQVNNEVTTNNEVSNVIQDNNVVADNNEIVIKKEENNVEEQIKSDFVMTAKPVAANLHTTTIEKSKDESKQSYIYSDNAGVESIEFFFEKIGSKYFYKYKTGTKTYPKEFSNSIEFVPNGGNIMLYITSQKRGSTSDLSGANIKITNNTDKSVYVNILDDDKNKPRVTILKEKGDIVVDRNYILYTDK